MTHFLGCLQGEAEFVREANVMLKLQHQYVVRLLGVCLSHPMMIVQELVALGALLSTRLPLLLFFFSSLLPCRFRRSLFLVETVSCLSVSDV
jgi:hypothetical protein